MANANVAGWHGVHSSEHPCDLCGEVCDERSADLNALDCTYSGCDSQVYHQECLEKYLRSIRCEKNRKTGFKCPRGCGKGTKFPQPCNGKITKSHPIHMQGEVAKKRKQHMQQPTVPAFTPIKPASANDKSKEEPKKAAGAPKILVKATAKPVVLVASKDKDKNKEQVPPALQSASSIASSSSLGTSVSSPTVKNAKKGKTAEIGESSSSSARSGKLMPLSDLLGKAPAAPAPVPNAWASKGAPIGPPLGAPLGGPGVQGPDKPPPPPPREKSASSLASSKQPSTPSIPSKPTAPTRLQGAWAHKGAPGGPSSPEPADSSVAGSEDVASSAMLVGSPESEDGWQCASGARACKAPSTQTDAQNEATMSKAQRKNLKRAERKAQRKAAGEHAPPEAPAPAPAAAAEPAAVVAVPQTVPPLQPGVVSQPISFTTASARGIPPPPPPRSSRMSVDLSVSPPSVPSSPRSGSGLPGCPPPPPRLRSSPPRAAIAPAAAAGQWMPPGAVRVAPAAPLAQQPMSPQSASTQMQGPSFGAWGLAGPLQGALRAPTSPTGGLTAAMGGPGALKSVSPRVVEEALQAIALRKALYCVNRLRQVGFPDWACVAAVARHGTNLEGSLEYLVGLTCQLSTDTGANLPDVGSPIMDVAQEQATLQMLCQYTDCSESEVAQAVIDCCGDLEAASAVLCRSMSQDVTSPSIFGGTASHCFSPMHEPPTSPMSASLAASSPRATGILRQQSTQTGMGSSWGEEGVWQTADSAWNAQAAPMMQRSLSSSLWSNSIHGGTCGVPGTLLGTPRAPQGGPAGVSSLDVPQAALLAAAAVTSDEATECELSSLMAAFQFT